MLLSEADASTVKSTKHCKSTKFSCHLEQGHLRLANKGSCLQQTRPLFARLRWVCPELCQNLVDLERPSDLRIVAAKPSRRWSSNGELKEGRIRS
jgi:hypothetical protein